MTSQATSVWIVEDNALYRRTLADLLNQTPGLRCPIAAGSFEEALSAFDEHLVPDIVLMDIGLPGLSGIEGTRQVRGLSPTSRVIMLTVHDEQEKIFEALCAGASGYLLKPSRAEQIVEAIRDVQKGAAPMNGYIARKVLDLFARLAVSAAPTPDYGLTAREKEILQLLVDGLSMKQVAARLDLSYHTIDTHQRNIYDKLHVRSRGSAVAKALRERLL
jgi:DNA-binding NarL/FixJ family response regulator